jgi:excisionase family DNA binding protein
MASLVDGLAVLITGEEAALVAPPLVELLRNVMRDGVALNPKLARAVQALDVAGKQWRDRQDQESSVCGTSEPCREADLSSSRFMTASQVAQLLGTSVENVRRRSRRGSLPARWVGSRWLLDRDAVVAEVGRRGGATDGD